MRRNLALFLISCLSVALWAQVVSNETALRQALAQNPVNPELRLLLGWELMQKGQYAAALQEYRYVAERDSLNIEAKKGLLWALVEMGEYSRCQREATLYLSLHPQQSAFYYYRAMAKLRQGKPLNARLDALSAQKYASDSLWEHLATSLLANIYQSLGDISRADKLPEQASSAAAGYSTSISAGMKSNSLKLLALGFESQIKRSKLGLSIEELLYENKHYRYAIQASAAQVWGGWELNSGVKYLDGKDASLYPLQAASLGMKHRFYLGKIIVQPLLGAHLAKGARQNSYQADLGMKISTDPLKLSYTGSYLYLDRDAISADAQGWVNALDISVPLCKGKELALYAGRGDMEFYQNAYGGIMDAYQPEPDFLGISFYTPLGSKTGLLGYLQCSWKDAGTYYFYVKGFYRV